MDRKAWSGLAALDSPGEQATQEGVILDENGEDLERLVLARSRVGFRDVADDQIEKRRQIVVWLGHVERRPALLARCIEMRKVELVVSRAHSCEEIEGVVQNPVGIGVRPVDLI